MSATARTAMHDVAGVEELQAAGNVQQAQHGGRLRVGREGEAAGQLLDRVQRVLATHEGP